MGGHSGPGGHIIKNAKLRTKPKKTQADSPKLRPGCKETRGINRNSVKMTFIQFKVIPFDLLLSAPSVVVLRDFTDKIKIC